MATDLGKVGMVTKGTYSSASTYEALDVVYYQNATYIARQSVPVNTAPTNTTYWQKAVDNFVTVVGGSTVIGIQLSSVSGGRVSMGFNYSTEVSGTEVTQIVFSGDYIRVDQANGTTKQVSLS